ncbi:ester cyclase [Micromonospora aurantiaca]|uniref:Ester cyclase n=1 Tax=Micromonospora aurantiaca (nom. illeg.) TaxID=47850 RepID=A0A1C6TPC2_9ACTN|nr:MULTISPECIES: ester cyclase [Micromonospora]ADU09915.1 protein of unknown function DUF1486 [Micromonospora sp. L5]AXH93388.1 ester cyclase [Micromonospora aurantiaca]MDG4752437.1 ester cyclase [Micromonospora sp. WMMD718]UFN92262.1 ester cyclase [Micromonospora aurantiaca]SCL43600.1 Predicted ester cyclase [Micromonospora aurantiaca]
MSPLENKNRCLQMVAAWNRADVSGVTEHWAPDVTHYNLDGEPHDTELVLTAMRGSLVSFSDLRLEVRSILAEGDRVMLRLTATATHSGEFAGIPATGRKVTWHYLEELRFNEEGKVVEHWDIFDFAPLFRELGHPAPAL